MSRVYRIAIEANFVMKVGTGTVSRKAHGSNNLSFSDSLARLD